MMNSFKQLDDSDDTGKLELSDPTDPDINFLGTHLRLYFGQAARTE